MLRINQIMCPIDHTEKLLFSMLCRKLKCQDDDVISWKILKRSVDARKKPQLFYSYTLLAKCREEEKLLKRLQKDRDITRDETVYFHFQATGQIPLNERPVIIGAGPAGLFCGLELARAGFCPILLERGRDVEKRTADVEAFWRGEALQNNSNVQFGEGGAGTFSDGKLNTLVKDKSGRNTHVLETFVEFGAKESILYDQKPHIGTDELKTIVKKMREEIISLGGAVRFESQVTDIFVEDGKPDRVTAVEINGSEILETDVLILAVGHSARDTLFMLHDKNLKMEAKAFAVGFRVQHPQPFINISQYGNPDAVSVLGAAPYKLTAKAQDGRGVYSFCMCPGGYVVNASSEQGHLAVNGMSYSKRDGDCANSAIVVAVAPEDYRNGNLCTVTGGNGRNFIKHDPQATGNDREFSLSGFSLSGFSLSGFPLSGIFFQRELERRAAQAATGKIPVQRYGEYQEKLKKQGILKNIVHHTEMKPFVPAIKGLYQEADLTEILPIELNRAFAEGMEQMDRKIRGFASDEVWLCGVESRTSSPVRMIRDDTLQSNIRGIYPCGEGAGYAGGITSAAMDGIKVAQEIAAFYRPG